jgi:hypothetical protein
MRDAPPTMAACRNERFFSLGLCFLSAILALAIVAAALLSCSPALHERLHSDAAATHLCVVTLFAAGHCESVSASPVFAPPEPAPLLATLSLVPSQFPAPAHFFALLEHAPPVLA